MLHGDIVTLTSDGIIVHEKALQPLAIFDRSICWGVWAANPHIEHPHYEHPNLIISPFHPSSWPFLIRLQIQLHNEKGALASACKFLTENNLSILFAECTPTGFNHATLTVIAESTTDSLKELRAEKQEFDANHLYVRIPRRSEEQNKAFLEARKIANKIVARMLKHARGINRALDELSRKKPPAEGDILLHTWKADGEHFLYDGQAVAEYMREEDPGSPEEHEKYIRARLPKSHRVHYMQRLAYFSIYGGGEMWEVPMRLKYHANSALLKFEEDKPEESLKPFTDGSHASVIKPLPRPAIGTFNSEDKYLRLNPVTDDLLENKLTQVDVEYKVNPKPGHNIHDAKSSQGVIWEICKKLKEANVDLLHLSNKWTRYRYANEAGLITFIADVREKDYASVKSGVGSINHEKKLECVELTPKVIPYPLNKLFFSIHHGHPREADVLKLVTEIAKELGFHDVISVETYKEAVTRKIIDSIKGCQAFLQLLCFAGEDRPETQHFSWLTFEYGVAASEGKPSVRVVTTSGEHGLNFWRDRMPIDADHQLKLLRDNANHGEIRATMREAIGELANRLSEEQ